MAEQFVGGSVETHDEGDAGASGIADRGYVIGNIVIARHPCGKERRVRGGRVGFHGYQLDGFVIQRCMVGVDGLRRDRHILDLSPRADWGE